MEWEVLDIRWLQGFRGIRVFKGRQGFKGLQVFRALIQLLNKEEQEVLALTLQHQVQCQGHQLDQWVDTVHFSFAPRSWLFMLFKDRMTFQYLLALDIRERLPMQQLFKQWNYLSSFLVVYGCTDFGFIFHFNISPLTGTQVLCFL